MIVDLWHCARGSDAGPPDYNFSEFRNETPYWFWPSFGEVRAHLDEIQQYVGEGESGKDAIYVKRGRFKFNPLLWFEDVSVRELMEGAEERDVESPKRKKYEVVADLLNHHPAFQSRPEKFDIRNVKNSKNGSCTSTLPIRLQAFKRTLDAKRCVWTTTP